MYCWNTAPVQLNQHLRWDRAALSQLVYKDLIPALPITVAKLPGLPVVRWRQILIHHYNMSETCRENMLAWLYYTRWQQKCSTTPLAKTVRPRSDYTSISLLDSGRTRHSQRCSDRQKTANKFIKETWISYETKLLHILPDSSMYPWEREGGTRGLQNFTASAIFLDFTEVRK